MKINKEFLIKSIIYRVIAFTVMYFISLIFTKKASVSFLIASAEFLLKVAGYYSYEYFWKWIKKYINIAKKP